MHTNDFVAKELLGNSTKSFELGELVELGELLDELFNGRTDFQRLGGLTSHWLIKGAQ